MHENGDFNKCVVHIIPGAKQLRKLVNKTTSLNDFFLLLGKEHSKLSKSKY